MSWSTKRKIIYTAILIFFLALFTYVLFLIIWHNDPTCFDGIRNQDEVGVDCGGICEYLCIDEAREPVVKWSKVFELRDGQYNALAYVENPNTLAELSRINYEFIFYAEDGEEISRNTGRLNMEAQSAVGVFVGPIDFDVPPASVEFVFTGPGTFKDVTQNYGITINQKRTYDLDSTPRIDAVLVNDGNVPVDKQIELTAIVYDSSRNPVGVSKTLVDNLSVGASEGISFTWPSPFDTDVYTCNQPTDVMSVIDRSGSMEFDSKNPPQPLTDVKEAAIAFVQRLSAQDRGGAVSFATEASEPLEAELTDNFESLKNAINGIEIKRPSVQHTNIASGLAAAVSELNSERGREDADSVIVLLTDGEATYPLLEGDDEYAEKQALEEASKIREGNILLYTIGLGEQIRPQFLKQLAGDEERYYFAPTADELEAIYADIATKICKDEPASVEILPRIIR